MDVLLTTPTHDGRIDYRTAFRLLVWPSQKYNVVPMINMSSALVDNMNKLWCMALNYRKQYPTLKWFAMVHSDIVPEKFFIDKLIAIAEQTGAAMVSAIAPFKDGSGITSTAIEVPDSDRYPFCRLTMQQLLHPNFPETFTIGEAITALSAPPSDGHGAPLPEKLRIPQLNQHKENALLLANTGCCIVRLEDWAEEIFFYNVYRTFINPDGQHQAMFESEDWNFSKQVAQFGKVVVTRTVQLQHVGSWLWDNNVVHGCEVDPYVKPITIWSLDDAKRLHLHSPNLAQWLMSYLLPKDLPVYDFGCGKGEYIAALEKVGFTCTGFEGTPKIESIAASPRVFGGVDITKPISVKSPGHVISLEVMEHILQEQEQPALENITKFVSPDGLLVLSWAVPGQTGHGHNNCRPASYVISRIEAFGFTLNETLTQSARKAGGSDLPYFNETIYVFMR